MRVAEGRFVVEGPQAVREALPALLEMFVDAAGAERHADLVRAAPCRVTAVSTDVLAAMAQTVTPQGIVGVAPLLDVPLAQALDAGPALVAVLECVSDPGNAGSVIRTADAAGAGAVVLTQGSTDPHGGKCVRATAGSLWHLPVVSGPGVAESVEALRVAGLRVLATTGAGTADLDDLQDGGARCAHRLAVRQRGSRPHRGGAAAVRPDGPHSGARSCGVAQPGVRGGGLPLRLGARAAWARAEQAPLIRTNRLPFFLQKAHPGRAPPYSGAVATDREELRRVRQDGVRRPPRRGARRR